jgi:hypothetical protein
MTFEERIQRQQDKLIRRADMVRDIIERTPDRIVQPGIYEVIESDEGGMRDYVQFTIEVTRAINLKEIALELIENRGYMSPWVYLNIRLQREKPTYLKVGEVEDEDF